MKILEIIPDLGSGGAERLVVDLSNQLAKMGHDITIMTLYATSSDSILNQYVSKSVSRKVLHKRRGLDLMCFFRIFKAVFMMKPDVVHAHVRAIPYLMIPAIFYRRSRYYATIHSEAKREAGSGFAKMARFFLFKCRLVNPVTISSESKNSFEKYYHLPSTLITNGSCEFIQSGEDLSFYHKNVDFLFVHIGRLLEVKNQLLLVKSVSILLEKGYKIRLLIIGRKENMSIFEQIKPYLSDNIVFLGEITNPRDYLNIADAFCLTSKVEGMPITLIEAFSVGCIPICTPAGGCVNMITNGINGFLSQGMSLDAYIHSLQSFIELSDEEKVTMHNNAKKTFMSKYSIETTSLMYLKMFDKNDK